MTLARTKAEGLALLSQLFLKGISACQLEFHGHTDLIYISLPLFNFVTRRAFTNHVNHLVYSSGRISE